MVVVLLIQLLPKCLFFLKLKLTNLIILHNTVCKQHSINIFLEVMSKRNVENQ